MGRREQIYCQWTTESSGSLHCHHGTPPRGNALDKTALVEKDITAGKQLTEALDDSKIPIKGSLWFYVSEASEWRLIVVTPLVDQSGPREAYVTIQRTLRNLDIDIPLRKISVMSPKHPLVQLLRVAVKTGKRFSDIRFTGNTINNVFIEDAYIYWLL